MNKNDKSATRSTTGFVLPSVILVSVMMLALLVAALQITQATSNSLRVQYYQQLAAEAAEAGVVKAHACIAAPTNLDKKPTWTNAKPLKPETDCNGNTVAGQNPYVVGQANAAVRSTFEVGVEGVDNMMMSSQGVVGRYRNAETTPWQSFSRTLNAQGGGHILYATSIDSGLFQVCAVLSGETWCNGANHSGQMGNGRVEPRPEEDPVNGRLYVAPERVLRETGALAGRVDKMVTSGQERACTVTIDNEIFCWGRSGFGALGIGSTPPTHVSKPALVQKPTGSPPMTGEITQIVTGGDTTCAISGGDLWCWGKNNVGQLGIGSFGGQRDVPVRVGVIGAHVSKPVTYVTTAVYSSTMCAVAAGDAYCWGGNEYGQIGDGTTTDRNVPTPVSKQSGNLAGKTVTKLVHAYGLRTLPDGVGDANAYCAANPSNRYCPTSSHTCALTTTGEMYCWGSDNLGQLGRGTPSTVLQSTPVRINNGSLTGKTIRDIATAYHTVCALTTEPDTGDRLYCWGRNNAGVAGLGHELPCGTSAGESSVVCSPSPVVMQDPGLKDKHIDSISGGVNRICSLTDGVSYCSGLNTNAQLGDGTTTTRTVPTEAKLLHQFRPNLMF